MTTGWVSLVYHEIPDARPGAGRDHFAVPAEQFARQLAWLAAHGYTGDSMENAALAAGPGTVGLTFDDGYRTHYEVAFPLLLRHGMRATFFVTTDWVGQPGYVTWNALREMLAAGMSIQSHTVSHPFLSTVPTAVVRRELVESKARLDDELGQATTTLALPGGDAPRRGLSALLEEAGYRLVGTSRVGANRGRWAPTAPPRAICRFAIRGNQPDEWFTRLVKQDPGAILDARARAWMLRGVRAVLGRQRYATWRRALLARWPGLGRTFGS